ncbi:hypothetical protein DVH24_021064 [Malus domestica]|uniref:Uncharacterized protein n=1 Tax=Malus domestica TaxID=3750 RepID=A0A498JF71_MALDO|nr:hypothetical protein DVH24_021064 [Malus domestica]
MTKWTYEVVAPMMLVQVPCVDCQQDCDSIGVVVAKTMLRQVSHGNCRQDSDILCIVLSGCNSSRDGDCGGDMLMGWWRNGGGAAVMIVVERSERKELHNKEK